MINVGVLEPSKPETELITRRTLLIIVSRGRKQPSLLCSHWAQKSKNICKTCWVMRWSMCSRQFAGETGNAIPLVREMTKMQHSLQPAICPLDCWLAKGVQGQSGCLAEYQCQSGLSDSPILSLTEVCGGMYVPDHGSETRGTKKSQLSVIGVTHKSGCLTLLKMNKSYWWCGNVN